MLMVLVYVLGLAVGVISAFLGIGGGVLIVPTLDILFPALPRQAVIGTCLAMIVLNSSINLYGFKKAGKWPLLFFSIPLFLGGSFGNILASSIATEISKSDLKLIFAAILSMIVLRIVFHKAKPINESDWNPEKNRKNWMSFFGVGVLGGVVSGMTGLGGGAVLVPAFMVLMKMPNSWLSPYSQVAMISSIWAVIAYALQPIYPEILSPIPFSDYLVGNVHFGLIIPVFLGVMSSSKIGIKFNNEVSQEVKKNILCGFFILVIIRILIQYFS